MAEFKISRFRYTWQGTWIGDSSQYNRDDIVLYEGKAWVCIRQHTSSIFQNDQTYTPPGNTLPDPAWVKMTDGYEFKGEWSTEGLYEPGNIVLAGGNAYLCLTSHTSSAQFGSDILKWEIFATGSNFRGDWTPATSKYRVGDVVRYNGYVYQCILEHTSPSAAQGLNQGNQDGDDDSTAEAWKVITQSYQFRGDYQTSTIYRLNDLVKYGGSILKCTAEHTGVVPIDNLKWETLFFGYQSSGPWNNSTQYAVGDLVQQGGSVYVAVANNVDSPPGRSLFYPDGSEDWDLVVKGTNFVGDWQVNANYKQGDLVRRGGSLWISLVDQLNYEDSTLEYLDPSNWEPVIVSNKFRGTWAIETDYQIDDVVYYQGSTYYSMIPHTSTDENFPGDNGSGYTNWSLLIEGRSDAGLEQLGDMLTYNLTRGIVGDGSSLGPTRVPIGDEDQVLVVEDNQGSLGYKTWGNIERVFHVRKNGIDDEDPNRGKNYFKPFKTIRYALEQADDNYSGHTSILVSAGEYQEILPMIVPARTAVVGEELRSVTVRANDPIEALASDSQYTLQALTRLALIIDDIITGTSISPTAGNLESQVTSPTGTQTEVTAAGGILSDIIEMIEHKVNGIGVEPTVIGTNTPLSTVSNNNARTVIENNRPFLIQEGISYVQANNPLLTFDTDKCERDLNRFIDALLYDLRYTGNYKSTLAGRYYGNAVIGSALEDMFYVRDATGLRNMSLKGLSGTLPALAEGDVYRIPTAGAYVSLDPGWGPDDTRTWITTRSCYVQNVTTFGTGAIGQKVDGSLHNGGNKSIVSNDFTQVISDGIGAWMLNGGRGELVSVFSYYAHIGMFAQSGGIIRATNGNSSYGDFGAIADGLDPDEVVRYGKINTRTEQAIIASAFAGEINDYILALEFTNAGQEYTSASYSITSSGTGATAIQEEFRDNALFEVQTISGGAGFLLTGNQAQLGDEYTITLASSESVLAAEILGMRIILISGEGTGQYGYVYSYNPGTKLCTVYRESDGLPGWDNVLPGTRSSPQLTTGTRYRFEPRPVFSEPDFTASVSTLAVTGVGWGAAAYGETVETFTNVQGAAGTGTTIDITPAAATFNITKNGREYSVAIVDGGAGYDVGDTITIDGASIGGLSIEHDLTITVVTTTDDSTNAISGLSISSTSIADSGKFVLAPLSGHFGRYSSNGDTWISFDFPTDGTWKCLTSGNNKFVAIANGSNNAASSDDGIVWTARTMPSSRNWNGVAYGKPSGVLNGVFVAVAGNLNAGAYSTTGTSWASTTLPTIGDSTINEWVDIAYGKNVFVALANSGNTAAVGTWNGTTLSWQGAIMEVQDSSAKDWVSIAYGNQRFVAISSTGDVSYSFNGNDWTAATLPTADGSTIHNWKQIRYGQGVFFAIGDSGSKVVFGDTTSGPTTFAATSYDGIVWTNRTLASSESWGVVAFGNPDVSLGDSTVSNSKPTWVIAPSTSSLIINKVNAGARALGRIIAAGGGVSQVRIWEPGSGYTSDPTLTIIDPNKTIDPIFRYRTADGVLAQPTFTNRGSSYKTSTTSVTVFGDGFADITPNGRFITVDGLSLMPGPGAQFYIGGRTDYFTAVVVDINAENLADGTIRSTFQISPNPTLRDNLLDDMEIVIREKYSQVRITGHDFLDVGTGNFEETNYPTLYSEYDFSNEPLQEVQNLNGGRVFYTSTDQDGNFRAGELFAVEQATGIITISADFFDLQGLTELRLGGVRVGSTAIIREFSKDPLFLQNSNNIIPTQRAVRSYLQSRLNIGGEDLLTPSVIAGTVQIGPNLINSSAGLTINIPVVANFYGSGAGVSGSMLAQSMFYRSFKDD